MTLTEFLLARIAEDEAVGRDWPTWGPWGKFDCESMWMDSGGRPIYAPRDRVLAECEAKRRRVGLFAQWDRSCPPDDWPEDGDLGMAPMSDAGRYLLRLEALPYADHPDYDEAWKA